MKSWLKEMKLTLKPPEWRLSVEKLFVQSELSHTVSLWKTAQRWEQQNQRRKFISSGIKIKQYYECSALAIRYCRNVISK
jgi:hypothetical protein